VWELYKMTGAGAVKLTTQTPSWAIAPACSPVDDSILFVSNSGCVPGDSAIWLWAAGDATPDILKHVSGWHLGDASPASALVLVVGAPDLYLPLGAGISRPVWSPNGTKIAYAAGLTAGGQIDIYVMDADGTNELTLEAYVHDEFGVSNSDITTTADEFCPYWLEDGSGIVYAKEDSPGDFQLYKVTFVTGFITPLTGTGSNVSPASKR
jgi:Tol biopolymer transport system component